jgi:hypothetical protein
MFASRRVCSDLRMCRRTENCSVVTYIVVDDELVMYVRNTAMKKNFKN